MCPEKSIEVIKLLLIEDDWRLRDSLLQGLACESKLKCVAAANDGMQALSYLRTHPIDLVIMDYALNKHSLWGVELTRKICEQFPTIKIMFWSAHIREVDFDQAEEAGASGYVPKDRPDKDVIDAIYRIMQGEKIWMHKVQSIDGKDKKLTPMEEIVMELLAEGKQNAQIAFSLLEMEYGNMIEDHGIDYTISNYGTQRDFIDQEKLKSRTRTVERHFDNIREKFNTRNRNDLFRLAVDKYGKLENRRDASENEIKALMLLHEGKKATEIAKELNIQEYEVENIRRKFDSESLSDLNNHSEPSGRASKEFF
ncbi:MAG: response regulator [Nitrosomonas sp.]|nr:MAG: response regulator [Nitrosomonas sp.]